MRMGSTWIRAVHTYTKTCRKTISETQTRHNDDEVQRMSLGVRWFTAFSQTSDQCSMRLPGARALDLPR